MIKRLLVPTDGSDQSVKVVETAVALACSLSASIRFLHVIDVKLLEAPFFKDLTALAGSGLAVPVVYPDLARLLNQRGELALDMARKAAEKEGVPCDTRLVTGVVGRCICEEAALCDLVVLGRTGENRKWVEGNLGSVTASVTRHASTPVMVTGDTVHFDDDAPMLVAFDASIPARKALKTAVSLVQQWKRHIIVLTVGRASRIVAEEAEGYVGDHGIQADFIQLQGDPAEQIVKTSRDYGVSVVVMGAFGHGRLRELMLGSTTFYVLEHVQTSLLLVR